MSAGTVVQRVLPGAHSGADLVPGVPLRVLDLAEQLEDMARGLRVVQDLLAWSAPMDGWQGVAAVYAAQQMRTLPKPYAVATAVIGAAAHAVRAHAEVLAAAQRTADEAVYLDLRAMAIIAASAPPSATVLPLALVTSLQRRALTLLDQARGAVLGSAHSAAVSLRAAADAAPHKPGRLRQIEHEMAEVRAEFSLGMDESLIAVGSALVRYSPNRLMFAPDAYLNDVRALGAGLKQIPQQPAESLRTIVEWENVKHNQGRLAGHLAPDVVLGVLTGGTATVANRGVSVGVRAAAVVTKGQVRADIRDAMSTARATSRARLRARDLRGYQSTSNEFGHVISLTPGQNLVTAALARDARWAEHDLTGRVTAAAKELGVKTVGLQYAVKGVDSLSRKVSEQLAKEGASVKTVIPKINDTVRYTLVADPGAYVGKASQTITVLGSRQMILVEAKNFWGSKRYQGLNMTFADPRTGRLVEVQLHTPTSYQAGVDTHQNYERYRQVGIPPGEKDLLDEQIGQVYAGVERPPGIDGLSEALENAPRWAEATNQAPELLSPQPAAIAGGVAVSSLLSGGERQEQR